MNIENEVLFVAKQILENDNFNLLDYYLITTINIKDLDEKCRMITYKRKITIDEYNKIYKFIKYNTTHKEQNKILTKAKIQKLLNETNIVDIEFDNNGNYIPNSGRTVLLEEKENVINYLIENNIPLTEATYRLAFTKLISNKEKQKIRKK